MENQMISGQEARVVEPIFRMVKVIGQKDPVKAQGLGASVLQLLNDCYSGQRVRPNDVQGLIKTVLLAQPEGEYYLDYLSNELQVKVAGWLTMLSVDLSVKIGDLGTIADRFAERLVGSVVAELNSDQVLDIVLDEVKTISQDLYERVELNREFFAQELDFILIDQRR